MQPQLRTLCQLHIRTSELQKLVVGKVKSSLARGHPTEDRPEPEVTGLSKGMSWEANMIRQEMLEAWAIVVAARSQLLIVF